MLGAAVGDMVGEPFEFAGIRHKIFEPFLKVGARFTDDTVCTVAVADSILSGKHPAVVLREWCHRYQDIGRWGQRFAMWFISEEVEPPYMSAGNGAAMRISPVGFLAESEEQVLEWSDFVTGVTHNHDDALTAARATALAIFWFRKGLPPSEVRTRLQDQCGYDFKLTVDEIRVGYRRSELASRSVPQAIACALEAVSFEDAVRNAVSLGGDSDTQAAIAGSIAEARFGIPEEFSRAAWSILPHDMRGILTKAYQKIRPL